MTTHDDDESRNIHDTTAYVVCSIIILVIGAGGNLLLIASVLVVNKLRTLNNAFIFNLVITDSLALILQYVLGVIGILTDDEKNPLANESRLCKVISYFCLSACICSMWSLTVCALFSYLRVCHKALFSVFFTPQAVTVMIFWLLALSPMIVLPSMMGWGGHVFDTRLMHCAYDSRSSVSFTYFMLTLGAWVPLTITMYCLIRATIVLRNSRDQIDEEPKTTCNIQIPDIHLIGVDQLEPNPVIQRPRASDIPHNNVNTLRSVTCVAFYLTLGWVTMSVVWIVGQWKYFGDGPFIFSMVLAHSPCCFNGLIYGLTNEDFREAYKHLLTFWKRIGKNIDEREETIDGEEAANVPEDQVPPAPNPATQDQASGVTLHSPLHQDQILPNREEHGASDYLAKREDLVAVVD